MVRDFKIEAIERQVEKHRSVACLNAVIAVASFVIVVMIMMSMLLDDETNVLRLFVLGMGLGMLVLSSREVVDRVCLHAEAVAERTAYLTTKV